MNDDFFLFISLFENMQLTNHFLVNFTTLNLYLKATRRSVPCQRPMEGLNKNVQEITG